MTMSYDTTEAKRLADAAGWVPVDQCPDEWKDGERVQLAAVYSDGVWWQRTGKWSKWTKAFHDTLAGGPCGASHVRRIPDPDQPDPLAASLRDAVGEIERLREVVAGERSVLDAWFDRRKLGHAAVDDAVLDAAKGYLRTCSNGGMPKNQVDVALAVIEGMAHLSIFADLYARALGDTHDPK